MLRLTNLRAKTLPRAPMLLLMSLGFAIATPASAVEIAGVSHRTRLYDSAAYGKDVFVVGHPGLVLRTSDQGQHFSPVAVPSQDALFSIDFNKAGLGAIVGRSGLVLLSNDGGATWSKTQALAGGGEGEEKPHLFSVDVLENGSIVAVGDFATIVYSSDRGKTWQKASVDASEPGAGATAARDGLPSAAEHENAGFEEEARLTGVSFGDDQHGFAVGEFGIIMASSDGGQSWKRQHSPTDKLLFAVYAVTGKHVIAAGSDGTILESKDGRQWAIVPTPVPNHLFGVWASEQLVLAVGGDGTVIRRGSPSGAFQVVPTHVHTWLNAVELYDGTHGFVAGGLGHLLSTQDAGQSFSHITGE